MLLAMPSRAAPECDDSSQARDCSGTARRAVLECDDSSQARDASGRLEESTRSATTRANEPGPGFLRHEPGPGLLRGGLLKEPGPKLPSRARPGIASGRLPEPPTKQSRAVACRHIPPHIPPLPAVQARGRRRDVRRCLARYQYTFQLLGMKSFS